MALTKLPKNAIADGAVKDNNIADGAIQNQDISGSISNDKLANSSFTFNGTEVSLGASQSIITYLDWQAVTVADGSTQVNAEAGKGYFLDTNAGVIEVFLPTSPSRGDVVGLVDYAGTFGTNRVIVNTGGVLIDSSITNDIQLTTNNSIVEFVYVDAAKGWIIYLNQTAGTTPDSALVGYGGYDTVEPAFISATGGTVTESGDFKIHTFTGDGCFVVSCGGNAAGSNSVDYLVVAGGGGGGGPQGGGSSGGGGAGGYREGYNTGSYCASPLTTSALSITSQTYPITVGGGGAQFTNGSNSVFSTITSAGGGYGGRSFPNISPGPGGNGGDGGSGGGGQGYTLEVIPNCGAGNTPPVSPPQGNPGGSGRFSSSSACAQAAGGGGGAGAAGSSADQPSPTSSNGGAGGNGATSSINGTPTTRAGGGGGGKRMAPGTSGSGGSGGGGAGGQGPSTQAVAGTANSGGGGGGAGIEPSNGAAGGKGIVIIRYKFQ